MRVFQCWAFSKDPSKILQVVFLTLTEHEASHSADAKIHFIRPRGVKHAHVFKVIIHVDVVEDLIFYHHPRAELIADGKVPWGISSGSTGCLMGPTRTRLHHSCKAMCS
jgi:hypothetical protein